MMEDRHEGIDARFDWETSFFRQVERIDNSKTLGEFQKNIDILECKMSPYIDDEEYQKDKQKAMKEFIAEIRIYGDAGVPKDALDVMQWEALKAKYHALMRLAYRCKILPQRNIPKKIVGQ